MGILTNRLLLSGLSAATAFGFSKVLSERLRRDLLVYRRVFNEAATGFVQISLEGKILKVNDGYAQMIGYSKQELQRLSFFDLMLESDHVKMHREFQRLLRGGGSSFKVEKRCKKKDGTLNWVTVSMIISRNREGRALYFFGVIEDTHQRKLLEEQVKKSETKYKLVARATNDAIYEFDVKSGHVEWSSGFESLFGYPAEAIGSSYEWWIDKIHPEDRPDIGKSLNKKIFEGTSNFWSGEYRFCRFDGTYAYVQDRGFLERNGSGEVKRMIGAMSDITQLRLYQNTLESTNKDLVEAKEKALRLVAVKSEFLSNMSHEIRTPLNAIIGMAEMLGDTALTPEQWRYVWLLRRASQTLLELVNDILDLSKLEGKHIEPEKAPFKPREAVDKICELLVPMIREKGLSLRREFDPSLPERVLGDRRHIEQVLMNILGNAIKFTEKGTVCVELKGIRRGKVHDLVFGIWDSGIGIPPEKLETLFQRFSQADGNITKHFGGTGLGLAISKHLVELMGGKIWAQSEVGKGTKFFIVLPVETVAEMEAPAPVASATESTVHILGSKEHRPHLLIVDDSADNREVIEAYLKRTDSLIEFAENGREALERFTRDKFDLVLMDMQMPVMDGYAATQEIRRWEYEHGGHRTPIIALSAYALKEESEKSIKAGCDAHLNKPVKKADLISTLSSFLH